ncbi:MAG: asparaginase domain-containing protein [Candidatus Diapherotrites archaeon]|nr:asparaginase domain-containing protein [Candidatus Diapherotrites archaeon]
MAKKKVLFLYNGGTIGQVPEKINNQIVLAPPKDGSVFKNACEPVLQYFKKDFDIDFEIITTKDSTNMTPNDWEKLIFRVKKAQDDENYDAVGIAHGTDTLAYSATALALALHGKKPGESGLRIPVCITGAQNPIYEQGGDGRFNLENLFRTLRTGVNEGVADVLINFWDRILLGCRTLKVSEKDFDAMKSPTFPDVGHIDAMGVHINKLHVRSKENAKGKLSIAPKFRRGVVSFELTPGLEPSLILGLITSGGVSAMILKSLGEGNVCSEGEFSLLPAIERATREYIMPIFITTKFPGGSAVSTHYEVGYKAIKAGGIPCYDHTDVAVDVKVRWLIGNGVCSSIEDFRQAMKTSYAGEVTPPKD